jgi:hypothetical protein
VNTLHKGDDDDDDANNICVRVKLIFPVKMDVA